MREQRKDDTGQLVAEVAAPSRLEVLADRSPGNKAEHVNSLFEAFNSRRLEQSLSSLADCVSMRWLPFETRFSGHDGYLRGMRTWLTGFPDVRFDVTALVVGSRSAAVEFMLRGVHAGPFPTPRGRLFPTGARVALPCAQIVAFEDDLISSLRLYFDSATLFRQVGADGISQAVSEGSGTSA